MANSPAHREILKSIESLRKIQDGLFALVAGDAVPLRKAEIRLFVSIAEVNMAVALEELKKTGNDKTREMLLVMEYFAAAGIRKSLSFAGAI